MRFVLWGFGLATLAAVVSAQAMPQCASDCLATSLESSTCSATDAECICADQVLMANVQTCVLGSSAQNATATMCKQPVRDKSWVAPTATIVTGSLALICVLVRVHDCVSRKEFKWADVCAVCAMAFSIPMDVFEFYMKSAGMGKDVWTLTPTQITNAAKETLQYTWVTQVAYIPAIVLTKVAVLCFFMQVFPSPKFRLLCYGTIVWCFLFMISTTIAAILACVPVEKLWTNWMGNKEGVCYDNNAFWWTHSAINIATDLWILGMPIPLLLKLQLKLKKKIYLLLMFSVGTVITVISIVRFSGLLKYSTSTNITYNNVMVATYSVIECNISIVCCCMPAILSALRRTFPDVFDSQNRSLRYNSSPFSSNAIQKMVTHEVTYMPRAANSDDAIELVSRGNGSGPKNSW
ncbi:CFEM domain-containing protein [Aspergillus foveolatus]|uniref:CFEM domain-containing protein n=1 Tax=Aspergillus foveolatus TaxID=210207 RepID=UPI003CCDD06B